MDIDVASLDGANGFVIGGVAAGDRTGYSVGAAGDVNGDGIADIVIGASGAGGSAGAAFIVFGDERGFGATLALGALDGGDGVRLDGIAVGDQAGRSVAAAGDLNGDGFGDVVVGAVYADPGGRVDAGESYVVFGRAAFGASVALASTVRLAGLAAGDYSGNAVAGAGDVDGDGLDDLVIGAPLASVGGVAGAGQSFVVFGGFGAAVGLGDGLRLDGIEGFDRSGISVAGAGDINGDGIDDLLIGAFGANTQEQGEAGESYVVFGRQGGFAGPVDLGALDGSDGFRLEGIDGGDYSGGAVAGAGDVNGDGIDDLVIGAVGAGPGGVTEAGESYVVFGSEAGFGASVALADLDGTDGFRIDGIEAQGFSGVSVGAAGDVNGDGIGDLIIGADAAAPGLVEGEVYVVYGSDAGFDAALSLGDLDGTNGFAITGVLGDGPNSRRAAGAGDVNGDGFADIVVGASAVGAGEVAVIFGFASEVARRLGGTAAGETLTGGANDDVVLGRDGADRLDGGLGDDRMDGGLGTDTITGGFGADVVRTNRGADRVEGGAGADTLIGFRDGQVLIGGRGDDTILAGLDADTIEGGAGNDRLRGDPGRDVFVFNAGFEEDRVLDFADRSDLLDFRGHGGVAGFGDLIIRASGTSVVVLDGEGGRLVLADTGLAEISAADFLF